MPARILLIHAGGYSTRLPHVSARGKVFMTLPQADSQNGIQVLELKLVLYLHLLTCMPPGVFLTSADGIELFSSKASFPSDPKPLTITALAHPSSTQIGSTHGVYLLHDPKGLVTEDRRRGPSDQSALMLKCQQFLHKPKLDVMKGTTGVIHSDLAKAEADVVYTDSCYYFDPQTADIMATTYDMLSAECDLEAWADILSFQDLPTSVPHPSSNSSTTTDNPYLRGRQKAKRALQDAGVVLDVMVLNASKFYHLGTMQEFLAGTCTDLPFMFELNIQNDVDGIALVQVFNGTASAVDCMHSPAYIERSSVSPNILIGSHSIVVDCNLPADAVIPRDTCMFTLQLQEHEFVTFTFSVKDDMKKVARTTKEFGNALQELRVFEHVPVSEMFDPSIGYPSECEGEVSLWTAVIFETARSEEESVEFARNPTTPTRETPGASVAKGILSVGKGIYPTAATAAGAARAAAAADTTASAPSDSSPPTATASFTRVPAAAAAAAAAADTATYAVTPDLVKHADIIRTGCRYRLTQRLLRLHIQRIHTGSNSRHSTCRHQVMIISSVSIRGGGASSAPFITSERRIVKPFFRPAYAFSLTFLGIFPYPVLTSKVNRRFSSQDKPLNLDGMQIKNKIENMKKLWKKANQLFSRTGNGARPDRLLKDKVLDICHFFYIMEVVWSTSWSMNPSAPCHLTSNLERHITRDASEDDSDENNGDEDISMSRDSCFVPISAQSMQKSKRSRYTGVGVIEMLEGFKSQAKEYQEIKRRKLEYADKRLKLERQKFEFDGRSADMQYRIMEMQMKKMQAEIDRENAKLHLEHRKLDIELMKLQKNLLEISRKIPQAPRSNT
ncbi:hypothetical protein BGZ54_004825 [Gamsiella multidivaricata]|nr:hypothetical protein BGZ54_004825 [Gamsiella multidivaricata]